MDLLESLHCTPLERVKEIGYSLRLGEDFSSEDLKDLAERISEFLLNPLNVKTILERLQAEEILALRLITLSGGGHGVIVEQCHQRLNRLSKKWRRNCAKVMEALVGAGLVHLRREDYRQIYFVPEDLGTVLSDIFLKEIYERISAREDLAPSFATSDLGASLRHLCLFLSYIRKNKVKMAANGLIFKKSQAEMAALLDECEPPEGGTSSALGYPPRLSLLFHFAKSKNLIEERSGILALTEHVEPYLKEDYRVWRKDLYDHWHNRALSQDADLRTVFWLIMKAPLSAAMSLDLLLHEMEGLSTTHATHILPVKVKKLLLEPLQYLGAIETECGQDATYLRPTPIGKALICLCAWPQERWDDYLYVQPNFEILIPQTAEPKTFWVLDGFSDLKAPDQMALYKLTKESVYRALLKGYTWKGILEFLQERSKIPVAQNISYSLSHWGVSYGRIEFEEAVLLKCDTKELAEELMMSPKIKPFVKRKVGPCYLLLDKKGYKDLADILKEEGYMPKLGEESYLPDTPLEGN